MRVTLIHNPDAGEGRPTQDELVGLLRRNGYDAKYVSAEEPNWTHALQDPGELIVAAGEDGTVAQVAKAVAGRGMPIALLPLGTANNIATSLGAWTDPNVQVARWKAARPHAFDFGIRVGRDGRESPFLESVGCGVFAEVLRADEQGRGPDARGIASRWGQMSDARAMFRDALRAARPRQASHSTAWTIRVSTCSWRP